MLLRFILLSLLALTTSEKINHPAELEVDLWRFGIASDMSQAARQVVKKVLSVEQAEGVGARVRRSVGRPEVSTPAPPTLWFLLHHAL